MVVCKQPTEGVVGRKSLHEGQKCLFVCGKKILGERRKPRLKSAKGKEGARAFAEAGATEEPT